MAKGSKIFFTLLVAALLVSTGITYYRYMVRGDYTVFLTEDEVPSPWSVLKF